MTDRELLELAAKAAGYFLTDFGEHSKVCWCVPCSQEKLVTEWDCVTSGRHKFEGTDVFRWSPLTDDGDALRLAVKLNMGISIPVFKNPRADVITFRNSLVNVIEEGNDPYAATRRAVVRAAAEIGRDMK